MRRVKFIDFDLVNSKKETKKRVKFIEYTEPKICLTLSDETLKSISDNFVKCVNGYHLINDDPIKETMWEDINAQVLTESGIVVDLQSNGSHKPGADLTCSFGGLSNKSTQYELDKKSFKVSSYRLTTVCSDKMPGNIEDIIAEINRRKNFKYYSIIVRNEESAEIQYDWYLIPSDCPQFDPSFYKWTPKFGKQGKNKGVVVGWETNTINGSSMAISFSMSSQLWIKITITDEMKKNKIAGSKVKKGRKMNYIELYNSK